MEDVNREYVNDRHHIRLAEYEDTGLEPSEITKLKNTVILAQDYRDSEEMGNEATKHKLMMLLDDAISELFY